LQTLQAGIGASVRDFEVVAVRFDIPIFAGDT